MAVCAVIVRQLQKGEDIYIPGKIQLVQQGGCQSGIVKGRGAVFLRHIIVFVRDDRQVYRYVFVRHILLVDIPEP